jgi:hypothetical protein
MTAKIPESVRRAIADPLVLGDGPAPAWTLPANLPEVTDVRKALPILRKDLEPAAPKDARWCLRKLAKSFGLVLDDDATKRWLAMNGKLPGDLWTKATLTWMQGDVAPMAEGFQTPVAAALEQRRTALARTEAILAKLTAPKPVAPFRPEPPEVRVRTLLKWALRSGDQAKAARYERELAAMENREPEAWTAEFPPASDAVEKRDMPTERRTFSPTAQRCAELARARHTGQPAPARIVPESRDIPEAA